ncbi:Spx/MgsR family RNA polymerase-binding regulatory protein [Leptospira idonii]|uniref:Spx/MgsR family RNA polymerase-binding regulatory protein n=1 Tax=Leptospira idonii TaxID=1193500 RepID=A0A4R9LZM4_9LEPT|nr:Spx/MgsR family RNA polymerase-binding regulatory protein [Leptospira idonii]TGN19884.1 Spx/MgsR family RNA polymerase-binding regulatory protein [Leptospira idonii]
MKNSGLKVYEYSGCGTCKKALGFLKKNKIPFDSLPIRETPPSLAELKKAKQTIGDIKKLFNVSGKDYREGNWKEKLGTISEEEALKALSKNGNLIKRPFVISDQLVLVGFKEEDWKSSLK